MAINVIPDITWMGNDVFQGTGFNIPIPSGIVVGTFLILGVTLEANQTNNTSVTVGGWTLITPTNNTDFQKYVFYKIADSGDAAGGNWACGCQDGFIEQWAGAGWLGVDNTTPFAVSPTIAIATTTGWSWNSLTSPGTGSIWVGLSLLEANSISKVDPTPPPTNQVQSSSPSYFGPATIYSAQVNSGSFAPSGSQGFAFEWATVAFFLNPASAPPSGISAYWLTC